MTAFSDGVLKQEDLHDSLLTELLLKTKNDYQTQVVMSGSVVDTPTDTIKQLKLDCIEGNMVVNLLASIGAGAEDLNRFVAIGGAVLTSETSNFASGSAAIKITCSASATWGEIAKDVSDIIDKTKYYCFSAYVRNGNTNNMYLCSADSSGTALKQSSLSTDNTKFNRLCVKLQPSELTNVKYFSCVINGTASSYGYIDALMIEEITASQYNDSNFVPSQFSGYDCAVGETFLNLKTRGKNMINLTQGSVLWYDGSYASMTTRVGHKYGRIPVKPNTTYTLSLDKPLLYAYGEFNEDCVAVTPPAAIIWSTTTITSLTFTTGATTRYVCLAFKVDDSTTIYAEDYKIQLEEGSVATAYEPYKESLITIDQPLRKSSSGIKDTIENGKLNKRIHKLILDGSLPWEFVSGTTGFKRVRVALTNAPYLNYPSYSGVAGNVMYKQYTNKALYDRGNTVANASVTSEGCNFWSDGYLYVDIAATDSGWGDAINPTVAEIQAYFNGWKMYDGTGHPNGSGVYNNSGTKAWCYIGSNGIYTAGTTVLPTTKVFPLPYRAYYRLKTPFITDLNYGNLLIYPNGQLIQESQGAIFVKPSSVKYIIVDSLKANLAELLQLFSSYVSYSTHRHWVEYSEPLLAKPKDTWLDMTNNVYKVKLEDNTWRIVGVAYN